VSGLEGGLSAPAVTADNGTEYIAAYSFNWELDCYVAADGTFFKEVVAAPVSS
jgi:hypothetical protein